MHEKLSTFQTVSAAIASSLEHELDEILKREFTVFCVEFQDSNNAAILPDKQLNDTVTQMQESIDLLHQQIPSCHQQIVILKMPTWKGDGCASWTTPVPSSCTSSYGCALEPS